MNKTPMHISNSITKDCVNDDSYGAICVKCNACGRFNEGTRKESALKMYEEQLKEELSFNGWIKGMEDMQKSNIAINIKYIKDKIKKLQ